MIKKLFYLFSFTLIACNSHKADKSELLKVDKEFSDMCMEKGMAVSFIKYAADDVVKMRPQEFPIMNRTDLQKMFDEHTPMV